MDTLAKAKFIRMSAQKGRLVADLVRGKKVSEALGILRFTNKKPARVIEKVIKSARANAEEKDVVDPDEMTVKSILVNKGPLLKRMFPRARGRADVRQKSVSHITVILTDGEEKPEGAVEKKTAKKSVAKKIAKKSVAKKTAKKAVAKKTTAKKTTKKAVDKKTTAKKTAKKAVAKKTTAKKTTKKK